MNLSSELAVIGHYEHVLHASLLRFHFLLRQVPSITAGYSLLSQKYFGSHSELT